MRASYNYNFEKGSMWRWQRTGVTLRYIVQSANNPSFRAIHYNTNFRVLNAFHLSAGMY